MESRRWEQVGRNHLCRCNSGFLLCYPGDDLWSCQLQIDDDRCASAWTVNTRSFQDDSVTAPRHRDQPPKSLLASRSDAGGLAPPLLDVERERR